MHPVRRGATTRGLGLVGHGTDRAALREGASKRERERERGEGVTSLKHNGYSCQFIKERGEPRSRTQVIGDKTLPFF
jgi:hypothetical protein